MGGGWGVMTMMIMRRTGRTFGWKDYECRSGWVGMTISFYQFFFFFLFFLLICLGLGLAYAMGGFSRMDDGSGRTGRWLRWCGDSPIHVNAILV